MVHCTREHRHVTFYSPRVFAQFHLAEKLACECFVQASAARIRVWRGVPRAALAGSLVVWDCGLQRFLDRVRGLLGIAELACGIAMKHCACLSVVYLAKLCNHLYEPDGIFSILISGIAGLLEMHLVRACLGERRTHFRFRPHY